MKSKYVVLLCLVSINLYSQIGIGTTTPNPKAILDIFATDKGILIPRLTSAQRDAIVSPPNGLLIYNQQVDSFQYYSTLQGGWVNLLSGLESPWTRGPGGVLYPTKIGDVVGIGTNAPAADLHIVRGGGPEFIMEKQGSGERFQIRVTGVETLLGTLDPSDLLIRTDGTERVRITANGNIGVGTATPDPTALLELNSTTQGFLVPRMTQAERAAIGGGAPATGLLVYETDVDPGFWYFDGLSWRKLLDNGAPDNDWTFSGTTLSANPNAIAVGIGTTTPAAGLEIVANTANGVMPEIKVVSDNIATSTLLRLMTYDGAGAGNAIEMHSGRGTAASPGQTAAGDNLGRIEFIGYDAAGSKISAARWEVLANGAFSASNAPVIMQMLGFDPLGGLVPRLYIHDNGNVGIGNFTPGAPPQAKFAVNGGAIIGSNWAADATKTPQPNGLNVEGHVGIGIPGNNSRQLQVWVPVGDMTTNAAVQVNNYYGGSNDKYVLYLYLSSHGTGAQHYGIFLDAQAPASSANHYGIYVSVPPPLGGGTFTGTAYGLNINMALNSGTRYGVHVNGEQYNYFSGNVGIGIPNPMFKLHVEDMQGTNHVAHIRNSANNNNADGLKISIDALDANTNNEFITFVDNNGVSGRIIGLAGSGVQYQNTSDARLKTNIEDFVGALGLILQMRPRMFEWKSAPGKKDVGFIAQELQPIYPYAVSGDPNGDPKTNPMGIDYGKLTPVAIAGIKELYQLVQTLNQRVETLEKEVETLKQENQQLKAQLEQQKKLTARK